MSVMDSANLIIPPLAYNGEKRGFLFFWRSVMQIALAFNFEPILRLPKEDANFAMAMAISPPEADERKQPALEATEVARKWYTYASPIIAVWLVKSIPQWFTFHLLSTPMGDAFASWSVICKKGHTNTKRAARRHRRHFNSLHMRDGVSLQDFVSEILFSCALLAACNSPVSDQEKLRVLYMGVTAPFFMTKTILEHNEHATFDLAEDAFTAVSEDIAQERAHSVRTNDNRPKTPCAKRRNQRFGHLAVFCPFCFAATQRKFPHTEEECWRKHGKPSNPSPNHVAPHSAPNFDGTNPERSFTPAPALTDLASRPEADTLHAMISPPREQLRGATATVTGDRTTTCSAKRSDTFTRNVLTAIFSLALLLFVVGSLTSTRGQHPISASVLHHQPSPSQQFASQQFASQHFASQQFASQQAERAEQAEHAEQAEQAEQFASQQFASQFASQQFASQQFASQQFASQQFASQQFASQQFASQQFASEHAEHAEHAEQADTFASQQAEHAEQAQQFASQQFASALRLSAIRL
jgi:hypothetical protein